MLIMRFLWFHSIFKYKFEWFIEIIAIIINNYFKILILNRQIVTVVLEVYFVGTVKNVELLAEV